jgi:hypothetical protein
MVSCLKGFPLNLCVEGSILDLVLQLIVGLVLLTLLALAITIAIYYRATSSDVCREGSGFEG